MFRPFCRRHRCGALVALLLVSTSCASTGTTRHTGDEAGAIRVVVDNGDWLDMSIFLESETGVRFRIGTVNGSASRTFVLRTVPFGSGWFRLVGDPIGSSAIRRSEPMSIGPGSTAQWRIGITSATSWLIIR